MTNVSDVMTTRLNVASETVQSSMALLSDAERRRANRFAFARERNRFIVARGRLRQLLAARLDVQPESIEFVCGANGKPSLGPRFADSNLRFNVSHCDDLAVYVFSSGCEVGIDVEAIRWMPDADDIAARLFSPHENDEYRALDWRDKPLGFFNCWTRKEAFIKALGDGLSHPLDSFDVSLGPAEPAKILRVDNTPGDRCGWSVESFSPAPGFVAAVVSEN